MKIVFVPNYFYLNLPFLEQIIYQFSDKGMETVIRDIFNDKSRCKIINNFNIEELI